MSVAACPGCVATPAARGDAAAPGLDALVVSLPDIHCAACVASVERGLTALPFVTAARVNLGQRRVRVSVTPGAGMPDILAALGELGHAARPLDADLLRAPADARLLRDLLMRLAVAGFAMMNVMILSVAVWSGATEATRDLFHWISAGIALPAVAFSALPFLRSAGLALRVGRVNMDVPISLAIVLACGMSLFETASGGTEAYFDAALSLTFFLLIGRYLEQRVRSSARSAAQQLAALETPWATRLIDGRRQEVRIDALAIGDRVALPVGMRAPVDGIVVSGTGQMDRSLVTGESRPATVAPGDTVTAGEVVMNAPLVIRATSVGNDTTLRQMAAMVEVAEGNRHRYASLADRAARLYAPVVHCLAALAFAGWYLASGDVRLSLNIAIAVLIITCPCALGLAVPAVGTAASSALFRLGLLVKSDTALERLAEADHVVFDKTGTLTVADPGQAVLPELDPAECQVLLALAQVSTHPVSRRLAEAGRRAGVAAAEVTNITETAGEGVSGFWDEVPVTLGRGPEGTVLRIGDRVVPVPLAETLRPGARELVRRLDDAGMGVELVSGDIPVAAHRIARELGIETVLAGVRPADKVARIAALSDNGHRVLMVGDGLNDTAALAAAHVSISPASAVEASRAASDIVLLGDGLDPVGRAVDIARRARRRILENFGIAACYNLVAIPVALSGHASPLLAALAMSSSSIVVILNAMRVAR
ncbi:copper-translocating P-type ATPase [Oceaniovalibus guishaninsula JLT2003]|uniref:Copper-translocating P-type ATPase n=1 Tax=Oceaniovalibus guishaninsula JLT2003 TaxID=1231392 RepID=K2GKQ0_9RHOB|nr:heavy metal translocating P-type ATPase [Oceaniovalibus guishaninsula]EKE43356.1 copper-translocating P-type ATPase [Oceaniovalibus guishaninsula JLT2003]